MAYIPMPKPIVRRFGHKKGNAELYTLGIFILNEI